MIRAARQVRQHLESGPRLAPPLWKEVPTVADIVPPSPTFGEDIPLFGGYEPPQEPPTEPLSADRRRTQRQAGLIAIGIHPLTKQQIHPLASRHRDADSPKSDPFTCGSCYFRQVLDYHNRAYPKCVKAQHFVTHGASTDVRAWWPACRDYSPGDSALSPDAARSIPSEVNA